MMHWDPNAALVDDSGLVPPYPEGGLVRNDDYPHTLHAMRISDAKTSCGLQVGLSLQMLMAWPESPWPRCRRCFR